MTNFFPTTNNFLTNVYILDALYKYVLEDRKFEYTFDLITSEEEGQLVDQTGIVIHNIENLENETFSEMDYQKQLSILRSLYDELLSNMIYSR